MPPSRSTPGSPDPKRTLLKEEKVLKGVTSKEKNCMTPFKQLRQPGNATRVTVFLTQRHVHSDSSGEVTAGRCLRSSWLSSSWSSWAWETASSPWYTRRKLSSRLSATVLSSPSLWPRTANDEPINSLQIPGRNDSAELEYMVLDFPTNPVSTDNSRLRPGFQAQHFLTHNREPLVSTAKSGHAHVTASSSPGAEVKTQVHEEPTASPMTSILNRR